MRILAVDTALADCQAAVVELAAAGAPKLLSRSSAPSAGDAEAVVGHVAAALEAAGVGADAISRVVVTVGPGSFTGVRVGLAYAKGFAAAGAIPVLGVTTLEGLARTFGAPSLAVIDARHGHVYASTCDSRFHMHRFGKCAASAAREMAQENDLPVVGSARAIEAVAPGGGPSHVTECIDLVSIAPIALDDPAMRPATARYIAEVDAAPQRHKSLARA